MSEKVPVDNDTRQVRAVTAGISLSVTTILVALFFVLSSCTEHAQMNPDSSRCLEGTVHVQVGESWGCIAQVDP